MLKETQAYLEALGYEFTENQQRLIMCFPGTTWDRIELTYVDDKLRLKIRKKFEYEDVITSSDIRKLQKLKVDWYIEKYQVKYYSDNFKLENFEQVMAIVK